jgi:hypothetical protein
MKLHITTQYMENYGAHDWDGRGICPQRWKFKGGEDYFYQLGAEVPSDEHLAELVEVLRGRIEYDHEAARNSLVGWGVVEDSFMTEFERSQLEYEGSVTYPAVMLQPLAEVEDNYYFGA